MSAPGETPLLVLLGPTASGKESAAVHASPALNAELIVADSVKPYRGLEIAAAAPPAEHATRVPHHLVGVLEPEERLSAARWMELAETAIAEIRARGRQPFVVGGSALYLKALLFGLTDGPPADLELRATLEAEEDAQHGALHARLADLDPASAARLHVNDRKRLLRALEVVITTGEPIGARMSDWAAGSRVPYLAVGLRRSREDLRDRIERRVARMAAAGLLDEVEVLVRAGRLGPTAVEAIGVKEIIPLVERRIAGQALTERETADALESVRAHTWQLARRQMNWWKQFPNVSWVDVEPDETPEAIGGRVATAIAEARTSPR